MGTFKASNGEKVELEGGRLYIPQGYLVEPDITALREFFMHERGAESTLWRMSEEHLRFWVVYPITENRVVVINESDGFCHTYNRGEMAGTGTVISCAYFRAHPVPKPWHDAKPGEVWELERRDELAAWGVVERLANPNTFVDPQARRPSFPVTDEQIIEGRRIWPEVVPGE